MAELKSRYVGKDYYEVFGVRRDAPLKDIQRSYRALALKVHPDRNNNSAESTRDFQELAHMMEVLSDKDRRANYDAGVNDEPFADAFATFRKVTRADIDSYSNSYLGSAEEKADVLFAYDLFEGDFEKMLEWIPLSTPSRLPTYEKILAEKKELKPWPKWAHRNQSATNFEQKYAGEEKEAAELLNSLTAKYQPFLPAPNPTKKEMKAERKVEGKEQSGGLLELAAGMRAREKARHAAMIESMEHRFAKKKNRLAPLPSEEEFAEIQKRQEKRRRKK